MIIKLPRLLKYIKLQKETEDNNIEIPMINKLIDSMDNRIEKLFKNEFSSIIINKT